MTEIRKFVWKNFSESTLRNSITPATTQIALPDFNIYFFPWEQVGYARHLGPIFSLVIQTETQYEVCYCWSYSGDVLFVERGKEGTSAQSFPAGTPIVLALTKGFVEFLREYGGMPDGLILDDGNYIGLDDGTVLGFA